MDLRALMQKLETLDKKKTLTESKQPSVAPQKTKTANRAVKENLGDIERALLEAFGLLEAEAIKNPYTGADAAKFAAMSPEDQAWLTKGNGVPDINDNIILARMPNGGKPVTKPAVAAPQAAAAGAQPAPVPEPAQVDTKPLDTPAPAATTQQTGQPAAPVAGGSNDVTQLQRELIAAGANLGTFGPNKDGIDGKLGKTTAAALNAHPEIAARFPALAKKAQSLGVVKPVSSPAATTNQSKQSTGGKVPPAATTTNQSGQPAAGGGESGRIDAANAVAAKQAEIDNLAAQQKQFPGRAQIGADIEYAQQDLAKLQNQQYAAGKLPQGQVTQASVDKGKQDTIAYLKSQLAATKDPVQKKSLQAAINSMANTVQTQSIAHSGNTLSEDDAILAQIKNIRY